MAGMADAFFMPTEDPRRFVGTRHTSGPWDAASQHGGPPAALLAREIERLPSTVDGIARVARLTVEILGPVPVGEVVLIARVVRPGRSVELVEAELGAGGRPVLIARAWRIRRAELGLPAGLQARDQPPALPSAAAVFDDPGSRWGYLNAAVRVGRLRARRPISGVGTPARAAHRG
jgi:acyl-CoA thioesterase superfamily protein